MVSRAILSHCGESSRKSKLARRLKQALQAVLKAHADPVRLRLGGGQ